MNVRRDAAFRSDASGTPRRRKAVPCTIFATTPHIDYQQRQSMSGGCVDPGLGGPRRLRGRRRRYYVERSDRAKVVQGAPLRRRSTTAWMQRPALRWAAFRRDAAFRSDVPARCGVPIRRFGVEQCKELPRRLRRNAGYCLHAGML